MIASSPSCWGTVSSAGAAYPMLMFAACVPLRLRTITLTVLLSRSSDWLVLPQVTCFGGLSVFAISCHQCNAFRAVCGGAKVR